MHSILQIPQEPDAYDGVSNKEATLLRMSFSVDEVEFALAKLGMLNFLPNIRKKVSLDTTST